MWIEVKQTNTQYMEEKSLSAGMKKAKKNIKTRLSNQLYRDLITDVEARIVPEKEMYIRRS